MMDRLMTKSYSREKNMHSDTNMSESEDTLCMSLCLPHWGSAVHWPCDTGMTVWFSPQS